jgi:hypothetical protein
MKNAQITSKNYLFLGGLCLLVSMLPGCWLCKWFSKEKEVPATTKILPQDDPLLAQGEKIVCMGDVCVITDLSLDHEFDKLLEENPQLKSVLPLMPNAKENFLQSLVSQAVVDRYIEENAIDQTAEYKKDYDHMVRSIKRMLNTKHFGAADVVELTDAQVQEYYEANKAKMPDLLVSNGGVKAEGIMFDAEDTANNFAAMAKEKEFVKAAKERKLDVKIQDFKLVNDQSVGMPSAVKNKIVSLTKFPAVEVIKVDSKTFWVVFAAEKQEPKYLPLEQIRAGLGEYIKKEQRMAKFDERISDLKKKYNVTINEEFLARQKEQQRQQVAMMQKFDEENAQAMEPKAPNIA